MGTGAAAQREGTGVAIESTGRGRSFRIGDSGPPRISRRSGLSSRKSTRRGIPFPRRTEAARRSFPCTCSTYKRAPTHLQLLGIRHLLGRLFTRSRFADDYFEIRDHGKNAPTAAALAVTPAGPSSRPPLAPRSSTLTHWRSRALSFSLFPCAFLSIRAHENVRDGPGAGLPRRPVDLIKREKKKVTEGCDDVTFEMIGARDMRILAFNLPFEKRVFQNGADMDRAQSGAIRVRFRSEKCNVVQLLLINKIVPPAVQPITIALCYTSACRKKGFVIAPRCTRAL